MFFDPVYFLFILPGLGLSLWAGQAQRQHVFEGSESARIHGAQAAPAPLGAQRPDAGRGVY